MDYALKIINSICPNIKNSFKSEHELFCFLCTFCLDNNIEITVQKIKLLIPLLK
jgi:hypothetical protein